MFPQFVNNPAPSGYTDWSFGLLNSHLGLLFSAHCHFPCCSTAKRARIQIISKRPFTKLNIVTCCVTSLSCVSDRGNAQPGAPNHHQHVQQNPVQRWDFLLTFQIPLEASASAIKQPASKWAIHAMTNSLPHWLPRFPHNWTISKRNWRFAFV
jgi:hypothetical protein